MPVENQVNKVLYNGDGTTKDFQFSFKIFKEENILVKVVSADGTETTKTLGTDYSIASEDFNLGGTVTMNVAPLATEKVLVIRSIPLIQDANFRPVSGFPEEVITDSFDAGIMIDQDLQEQINRCLRAPSFVNTGYALPVAEAGKALIWDKEGKKIVNSDETINNVVAESTAQAQIATEKAAEAMASASAAATSETNAKDSENSAEQWATKTDGKVDGIDYSAKYWAEEAKTAVKGADIPFGAVMPFATGEVIPVGWHAMGGEEVLNASDSQYGVQYTKFLLPNPDFGGKVYADVCTYQEYEQMVTDTGACPKFAVDSTANKFKFPLVPEGYYFKQGQGTANKAGLPNITGNTGYNWGGSYSPSGAFTQTGDSDGRYGGTSGPTARVRFDASLSNSIYGRTTNPVETNAVGVRWYIFVANGEVGDFAVNWDKQQSVVAGKANADMNNLSTAGKAEVSGLSCSSLTNYKDKELLAANQTYTADDDCDVTIIKRTNSADRFISIALLQNGVMVDRAICWSPSGFGNGVGVTLANVPKGATYKISYTADGDFVFFRENYKKGARND